MEGWLVSFYDAELNATHQSRSAPAAGLFFLFGAVCVKIKMERDVAGCTHTHTAGYSGTFLSVPSYGPRPERAVIGYGTRLRMMCDLVCTPLFLFTALH